MLIYNRTLRATSCSAVVTKLKTNHIRVYKPVKCSNRRGPFQELAKGFQAELKKLPKNIRNTVWLWMCCVLSSYLFISGGGGGLQTTPTFKLPRCPKLEPDFW